MIGQQTFRATAQSLTTEQWALAKRLAARDPWLLMDYGRWYLEGRLGNPWKPRERRPIAGAVTADELQRRLAQDVATWADGPALARVRAWAPSAAKAGNEALGQVVGSDASVGEVAYGLIRALRPHMVVETGVASGLTSAYALAGLADNRVGELHSIDLPPTHLVAAGLVGSAVPSDLRDRWVYHWGSSRRLLPKILGRTAGAMGLFMFCSDIRYGNMRWELERAWESLVPGGWLLVDEVNIHSAFQDVAAAVGAEPVYLRQVTKPACAGLLRKTTR